MKRTKKLAVIIGMLVFAVSFGQDNDTFGFEKGDFFISGSASYGGEGSSNPIYIEPAAGYFLTSHISLGLQSRFLVSESNDFYSSNVFGIGINSRYYFMPKKRFNVFAELAFDYISGSSEPKSTGSLGTSISTAVTATTFVGVNYFISKNISLFAKIDLWKYSTGSYEVNGTQKETFSQSGDFSSAFKNPSLGIKYKF